MALNDHQELQKNVCLHTLLKIKNKLQKNEFCWQIQPMVMTSLNYIFTFKFIPANEKPVS